MKRIFVIFCVCLFLVLSLCACDKELYKASTEDTTFTGNFDENRTAEEISSAGDSDVNLSVEDTSSTIDNNENQVVVDSDSASDSTENVTPESLYEKLIREIEGAYLEEQKAPENSATIAMIELSDKYAAKWKQVADEYYDNIMKYKQEAPLDDNYYSDEDLHSFVSNMKINWEEYSQEQCDNYLKTLQAIYKGGTIIGPIFADYKYEMQKEWALQLVDIYQQL